MGQKKKKSRRVILRLPTRCQQRNLRKNPQGEHFITKVLSEQIIKCRSYLHPCPFKTSTRAGGGEKEQVQDR